MWKGWMVIACLTAFGLGCDRGKHTESTSSEPIGGGPKPAETVTVVTATDRMADASCKVSLKCDQIGEGKKAGVYQSCIANQKDAATKDVAGSACPKGVDSERLNACLDRIRATNCDDITSSLATLDACKASALCVQ